MLWHQVQNNKSWMTGPHDRQVSGGFSPLDYLQQNLLFTSVFVWYSTELSKVVDWDDANMHTARSRKAELSKEVRNKVWNILKNLWVSTIC